MSLKPPHLCQRTIFSVTIQGQAHEVRPVDGELWYDEPGLSHGLVHFADPVTGRKTGFCGVSYFDKTAVHVQSLPPKSFAQLVTEISALFPEENQQILKIFLEVDLSREQVETLANRLHVFL